IKASAIHLEQGGVVANQAGGVVTGYEFGITIATYRGVPQPGGVGTVVNLGTIASTGTSNLGAAAIRLGAGGTIDNFGTIDSAAGNAITITGTDAATIGNFGLIENFAAHAAIYSAAGGVVTNAATAAITSTLTGISFNDTAGTTVSFGTVDNNGTILSTS